MGPASDYIDLVASGDRKKINCVLLAAGAGAVTGGVSAGVMFAPANAVPLAGTAFNGTAAAIGAVLGMLAAGKAAFGICGVAPPRGQLQEGFAKGRAPRALIEAFEADAMIRYGLSGSEARQLSQLAVVHAASNPPAPTAAVNPVAMRNTAIALVRSMPA